ncbi:M12 family metallo-peptidase [Aquimarina sp. D1M17]|uniref:reprolysin-like metallopeptidase n=1 Tax=Aquimarina acroporae TaxID=2937283 RepID=UPI0020C0C85C|nr:zinc-dependent metalloprotease family protein [Aquimarina acroporae]MCK8521578.1 M12 family metallo-peptidase [Aquimarina acroporae]
MKTSILKKMLVSSLFIMGISIHAQVWTPTTASKTNTKAKELRKTTPNSYKLFTLNSKQLTSILENTPSRSNQKTSTTILELPAKDGDIQRFSILEASIFEPELAKKFPDIKSYVGYGIDDPTSIARFSLSKSGGMHVMISSGNHKTIFIDPYTKDKQDYIAYYKTDLPSDPSGFRCMVEETVKSNSSEQNIPTNKNANDGRLRTFRLAVACTGEYSQFHLNNQGISSGATDQVKKAAVLAAVNTTMTRVNGIFERDLSLTMVLVNNNDDIIFLNPNTDNLSNNSAGSLINESQTVCDNVIGFNNYDIGHAFSTGGGGLAQLRSPCTNSKARGITGQNQPIGDPYDVDYVAHEMGHQYGGNHTQNNSCQRSNASVEPGSASTIMGYAGICSPNVQNNSDAYFHAISIQEMWQNISQGSSTCGAQSNTGNAAPTANAGSDYTIPSSTPFILKGNATDANTGNTLTYCWEQMDAQPATMPPSASSTNGPAFRSLNPTSSPDRYMPALPTVIAGQTSSTWEVVPSVSRTMNFRLTVRDNAPGGGSTASDNMRVTVAGGAGPFVVNSPNTSVSWPSGSTQTVTWNVAGTTGNGINAANVDILLSTNGGNTYPITIASAVTNDGSHAITVPNAIGTQNRIMVRGSNHIFYDISNTNFEITSGGSGDTQAPSAPANLTASNVTQTTVNLDWDASTDNTGVTGYDIFQGSTVIATTSNTSFQVSGLSPNTAYTFSITAKDAAGNESNESNSITVTTQSSGGGTACNAGISTFPYNEGFENTLGAWTQGSGDDFNWTVDANGTPSRNTGPSSASQGTYYIYMESSTPNYPSKRAILNSPCFDLNAATSANFIFQYHMYGRSDMGSLALEASTDNGSTWTSLWSKSGNQGNSWQSANVDLSSYAGGAVQLRFNGVTGNTWQGDMAIDDIRLNDGGTAPTCTDVVLTLNFDDYPQETSWQITNATNQTVASGGTYGSQPDGSTLTITECLAPGTYTFTLNDSYGDGICCAYGNGSYTLVSQGNTIASGGQFGSSESTTFTIGNTSRSIEIESVITTDPLQIMAFPNPVKKDRILNIIVPKQNSKYEIINSLGVTVMRGELVQKIINTSQLPSGMYMLRLNPGGEGKIKTISFIQE